MNPNNDQLMYPEYIHPAAVVAALAATTSAPLLLGSVSPSQQHASSAHNCVPLAQLQRENIDDPVCRFIMCLSRAGQAAGSHRPGSIHALLSDRVIARGEPTALGC
jgi:hypothetical protein